MCTETVKYNIYWDIDFCKFQGTLMLSEFTACSHVIPGALRTNPWREEECARVIIKSLRQPAHERQHWQEQQLAWYYIVKRDLLQCQKRPITVSKETYYILLFGQIVSTGKSSSSRGITYCI